jgi:lipopolysaccharide export system permease protein
MRGSRTLSFYLLREVLQYGGIGLLAVSSVLVTQNLLRRLEDLVSLGVQFGDVVGMTRALFVMLSAYVIPMAFLFGILVAVGRLSSDSEITAMRGLGVSIGQLVMPLVIVALLISAGISYLLAISEPNARRELRAIAEGIASRGGILEPGRFNDLGENGLRMIFVDSRDGNHVKGVVISDQTDRARPYTVLAESGVFSFDQHTSVAQLVLHNGDIHFMPLDPNGKEYQHISFSEFSYAFSLGDIIGTGFDKIPPREMTSRQILWVLAYFHRHGHAPPGVRVPERVEYEIQAQWRLAVPVAPLLFALIGVPLGLRRSRGARSWGILICVVAVFSYYMLLSAGDFLAEKGSLPASISIWIPNAVFAVAAALLLWRSRRAEI